MWPNVLMINNIGQSCLRKDQSRLQMCSTPETLTPDATLSLKVLSSDDGTSLILPGTFSSMFSRGLTWGMGLLVGPGFATLSVHLLDDCTSESLCILVLQLCMQNLDPIKSTMLLQYMFSSDVESETTYRHCCWPRVRKMTDQARYKTTCTITVFSGSF